MLQFVKLARHYHLGLERTSQIISSFCWLLFCNTFYFSTSNATRLVENINVYVELDLTGHIHIKLKSSINFLNKIKYITWQGCYIYTTHEDNSHHYLIVGQTIFVCIYLIHRFFFVHRWVTTILHGTFTYKAVGLCYAESTICVV